MDTTRALGPTAAQRTTCASRDRIGEAWPKIIGKLRRRWPRLTPEDLAYPYGSAEYLAQVLQVRYDIANREALEQIYEFEYDLCAAARSVARSQSTTRWRTAMNEDKIKGQWKQLHGKLKAHWGKLTDDDLKVADGSTEYLAGKLQERYGIVREEARKQIREFGVDL